MEWKEEMKLLKEQVSNDLQITWRVMGDMDHRLGAVADNVDEIARQVRFLTREMSDGFRTARGQLRLVDERLGRILQAVENRMDSLEERVDRLEKSA